MPPQIGQMKAEPSEMRLLQESSLTHQKPYARLYTEPDFTISDLTLQAPDKIAEFANTVDPNEEAFNELPQLGLQCLPSSL